MEQEWRDAHFSVQTIEDNPEHSSLLSIMADELPCVFCCLLSPACPLSAPAFILFSSYSISKQIGFYSVLLSISHLLLSISTTVQKQFYYVRLYFYSQLKRLLKYNIACRAHSSSVLASCQVLEREAFWGIRACCTLGLRAIPACGPLEQRQDLLWLTV